jgi:hypothetical protein
MLRLVPLILFCLFLNAASTFAQQPAIKIIRQHTIPHFPSASSVVYFNRNLYVIGDDSRDIVILDREYKKLDSIRIFAGNQVRIKRDSKTDIESAIISKGCRKKLILFGSGSTDQRKRVVSVPVQGSRREEKIKVHESRFYDLMLPSAGPLNIEGATRVEKKIVFGNRLTKGYSNHLLTGELRSVLKGRSDALHHTVITMPDTIKNSPGISDMLYIGRMNMVLITFSSEETDNPLEDGAIGDSYIGWIADFDGKLSGSQIALDGLINLSMADSRFRGEKIEGICVEKISKETITAHLVSDNDDGKSTIFKVEMRIEKL